MSRLKIALVGCGGMARSVHLPAIALLKDELEFMAACDRSQEAADTVTAMYGGRAYTDLTRMLGEEQLDIVAVTVHAQHHHTVAIEALNAGKHVIVEKPLAITMPCAHAMLGAAKNNGVMIEVTENYLRMPMDAFINTVARSGLLGPTRFVNVCDPVNGASLDIAVHRYSQLREAAGGWPTAITAMCRATGMPREEPSAAFAEREFGDTRGTEWGVAMVDFDNGVIGKCEHVPLGMDKIAWPPDLRQIVCDKGGISDDLWPNVWPWTEKGFLGIKRWGGHGGHTEVPWKRTEETIQGRPFATRVELVEDPSIAWENPVLDLIRQGTLGAAGDDLGERSNTWPDWFVAELTAYATFARAVLAKTEPEYGGERGANDLELSIATYEAERVGGRVQLPLKGITPHERHVHEMFEEHYGRPIL